MFESTRRPTLDGEEGPSLSPRSSLPDSRELRVQTIVQRLQHSRHALAEAHHPARGPMRQQAQDGETSRDSDPFSGHSSESDSEGGGKDNNAMPTAYGPDGAEDRGVWQLENIRHFTIELSALSVMLHGTCTRENCPQMKATDEWMYLCAAHKQPQECSAMDYIIHTLDGTCSLLTSCKWFPSRTEIPASSTKYFQSITRRLYRILSHTYFHHRAIFDMYEARHRLCGRFVAFARAFDLIPPKLLIIPESGFAGHSPSSNRQEKTDGSAPASRHSTKRG